MRSLLIVSFLLLFTACDNGDIEVPSFDFESQIHTCNANAVLYRVNSDNTEALIIQFSEGVFGNEAGVATLGISAENCNYRIFDTEFSSDYFCADVPPVTPIVIKNWLGTPGPANVIEIETIEVVPTDESAVSFEYHIVLKNLILQNDGENITYDTYDFGTIYSE